MQNQKQKQLNKQIQSLHYTYETLLHLLSSAENFAGLKNEQYEAYNISTATRYEDLKSEFIWELDCFQLAMKTYIKKYGEYIFPNELPKDKILSDIKRYIDNIKTKKEEDKVLYYAMINIIEGKKTDIDFDELFEKLEEEPEKKFDPKKLKNLIGPINNILNEIEKNEKKKFEIKKLKSESIKKLIEESHKNENMSQKAIIGKKGHLSKKGEKLFVFKNYSNNEEEVITFIEEIKSNILIKCKVRQAKEKKEKEIEGNIYFLSKKDKNNVFDCVLFYQASKDIKEKDYTIIDPVNRIGKLKKDSDQNYILIEDNKEIEDLK